MLTFYCFIFFCFCALLITCIEGLNITYGDNFKWKMYLRDKKSMKQETVMDDGSYVIKDGVVTGRLAINGAEKKENVMM